jgi:hypothetical protein
LRARTSDWPSAHNIKKSKRFDDALRVGFAIFYIAGTSAAEPTASSRVATNGSITSIVDTQHAIARSGCSGGSREIDDRRGSLGPPQSQEDV